MMSIYKCFAIHINVESFSSLSFNDLMGDRPPPPIEYASPEWARPLPPSHRASFEVIKNHTLDSEVEVKDSMVFLGRHPDSLIELLHPSISRFHVVFQYGIGPSSYKNDEEATWWMMDYGSTHGTRLGANKNVRIEVKKWIRVPSGESILLGESTRSIVLIYEDDASQKQYQDRDELADDEPEIGLREKRRRESPDKNPEPRDAEEGVHEPGEEAVLRVPKFENEDEEDVDEFFDRATSGKKRRKSHGEEEDQVVDTYESLLGKQKVLREHVLELELKLQDFDGSVREGDSGDADEEDELEAYMSGVTAQVKQEDRHIVLKDIARVKKELETIDQLVQIAKP